MFFLLLALFLAAPAAAQARTVSEDRFEEGKTAYRILHTTGIDHYHEHIPAISDWRNREGI